uniref:Uncharacterized protein n=1 Tax=Ditylenchus dipsaci TaxID=166011 RepID=A0A915ENL9_9BILA
MCDEGKPMLKRPSAAGPENHALYSFNNLPFRILESTSFKPRSEDASDESTRRLSQAFLHKRYMVWPFWNLHQPDCLWLLKRVASTMRIVVPIS